MPETDYSDY